MGIPGPWELLIILVVVIAVIVIFGFFLGVVFRRR